MATDAHLMGATRTSEETETRSKLARPWKVIVHDDPVTLMSYVTKIFTETFGYPETKARQLMLEVHQQGCSVVWTGGRERAEVYTSKLQGHHLLATLEQVEN